MATLTVYPQSIGTANPMDGYVGYDAAVAYSTAHDATTGSGSAVGSAGQVNFNLYNAKLGGQYYVYRNWFCFDTSALTSGATISSAVLSLYNNGSKTEDDPDHCNIHIVASTPASTSAIATTDFDAIDSTSFSSVDYSNWTQNQYNDFTLNASGIANISKTGISTFGARLSGDIDNSTPTGTNVVTIASSGQTGTDKDPKLVITYSTTSIKTINGLAIASVKTVNGLAIASVKSINGLA